MAALGGGGGSGPRSGPRQRPTPEPAERTPCGGSSAAEASGHLPDRQPCRAQAPHARFARAERFRGLGWKRDGAGSALGVRGLMGEPGPRTFRHLPRRVPSDTPTLTDREIGQPLTPQLKHRPLRRRERIQRARRIRREPRPTCRRTTSAPERLVREELLRRGARIARAPPPMILRRSVNEHRDPRRHPAQLLVRRHRARTARPGAQVRVADDVVGIRGPDAERATPVSRQRVRQTKERPRGRVGSARHRRREVRHSPPALGRSGPLRIGLGAGPPHTSKDIARVLHRASLPRRRSLATARRRESSGTGPSRSRPSARTPRRRRRASVRRLRDPARRRRPRRPSASPPAAASAPSSISASIHRFADETSVPPSSTAHGIPRPTIAPGSSSHPM